MKPNTGSCLCGEVRFEIRGPIPDLYQCHCSLCRKATGSAANAAFIVRAEDFAWRGGQAGVRSFRRSTGYPNDFCGRCGSPVPLAESDGRVWVPAGAMDGAIEARVTDHYHVGSKATWDAIGGDARQHEAGLDS